MKIITNVLYVSVAYIYFSPATVKCQETNVSISTNEIIQIGKKEVKLINQLDNISINGKTNIVLYTQLLTNFASYNTDGFKAPNNYLAPQIGIQALFLVKAGSIWDMNPELQNKLTASSLIISIKLLITTMDGLQKPTTQVYVNPPIPYGGSGIYCTDSHKVTNTAQYAKWKAAVEYDKANNEQSQINRCIETYKPQLEMELHYLEGMVTKIQ